MASGFFPLYLNQNKKISLEMTGYIFSSQTFVGIFISILFAHYTRFFNRNSLVISSIIFSGFGNIFFCLIDFTDNQLLIIIISFTCRILNGIGFALGSQTIYAYIPIFYKNEEVYKYGILESAASIGQILGQFVGAVQYEYGGVKLPFCSIGLIILCTIPLVNRCIPQQKMTNNSEIQKNIKFSNILSRQTIGLIITCIVLFTTSNIQDVTLGIHLQKRYQISETNLGIIFSLISLFFLFGIQLLNFIQHPKLDEFYIFIGLLFTSFGIQAFGGQIFFIQWDDFNVIYVGTFLLGFFQPFFVILFIPVLMEKILLINEYPIDQVSDYANGIFQFSFLGGFTIGPSLGSILTTYYDFIFSTKIVVYVQFFIAFLYLVLFSDMIFKNKKNRTQSNIQQKILDYDNNRIDINNIQENQQLKSKMNYQLTSNNRIQEDYQDKSSNQNKN